MGRRRLTATHRTDLGFEHSEPLGDERIERLALVFAERGGEAVLIGDVRRNSLLDERVTGIGKPNQKAAPVVRVAPALDQSGSFEPVYAVGHCA